MVLWRGIAAPKGTPKEVIARLEDAVRKVVASPQFKEHSAKLGFEPAFLGAGDFGQFIAKDDEVIAKLMSQLGTKTSLAIADGFISCWDEKYRSNLIRPETLINQHIDPDWLPVLQTPPFPEYSSGHSVVSGAASVILTEIFGDNFYFEDDTELQFGLPMRSFKSFYEASSEAAISRMYGGIHYRAAIENGLEQGKRLGHFIAEKLEL
jgi:hypothetical protein